MQSTYDGDTLLIGGEMKSRSDECFEHTRAKSLVQSAQSFVGDDLASAVHEAVVVAC